MSGRARVTAWTVLAIVTLLSVASSVASWRDQGVLPLFAVAAAAVGTLILIRAANPIGWLFDVIGATGTVLSLTDAWLYRNLTSTSPLPGVGVAAIVSKVAVFPAVAAFALLLLLFPTGRPPSHRWAPLAWVLVGAPALLIVSVLLQPGLTGVNHAEGITNPFGVVALRTTVDGIGEVAGWVLFFGCVAAVASLVVRFHRSSGDERQQLRWLAAAGSLALVGFLLSAVVAITHAPEWVGNIAWSLFIGSLAIGVPAAVVIAILKYRLYDIDLVISKTIVYGVLAGFIGAMYAAVAVGVRVLLGIDASNPLLAIAATGLVAITFEPVRRRVQRFANRIVYGVRASPYEVLTRFSERVGDAYATEDVLPRTARVIAEGVQAERATVWLRLADELRPAATWPEERAADLASVPATGDAASLPLEAGHAAPIRHGGELLGAITVDKPGGEALNPEEVKLVDDLAAQAGLVVSNVRLTADLEARLDVIARQAAELRASRQRIVAAQDEERRRLERNIHDGAQQHLVALAVKLRLARGLLARDPERARAMLAEIRGQIDDALDTLRALALGIYPPLLEEQGVAAAIAARYVSSDLPVRMRADGIRRYPIETEAAVYFCVLEALQNAAKYAHARTIDVALAERGGALTFEVADDGAGFDPAANGSGTGLQGMRDRLAVLGGDATLTTAPGRGTVVTGRVPLDVGAHA